jgi:osmotically-inducible protein OsmY
MVVETALQIKTNEQNRCRDMAWSLTEDQKPVDLTGLTKNDLVSAKGETLQTSLEGLIHVGQDVFLTGDQPVGRIVKLITSAAGQVSHLVIQAAHFWWRQKTAPVELVTQVTPKEAWLSIDRKKFLELPEYKTDAVIKSDVENALWKNELLRVTDYHEIHIEVSNGVVTVTGHVAGMMNHDRVALALGTVKGIVAVRIRLVADDKLLIKVCEALIKVERIEGGHVFAKVDHGLVVLSGKVTDAETRILAEQCAGSVPGIRGVMNEIAAPGVDLEAEDQRFLQPVIGEQIYFRNGPSGYVRQVVLKRSSLRVAAVIIAGRFHPAQENSANTPDNAAPAVDRLVVIPVSAIQDLTSDSGLLLIDSTDTAIVHDFDPANFVAFNEDWVPPYPYCYDDVRFFA